MKLPRTTTNPSNAVLSNNRQPRSSAKWGITAFAAAGVSFAVFCGWSTGGLDRYSASAAPAASNPTTTDTADPAGATTSVAHEPRQRLVIGGMLRARTREGYGGNRENSGRESAAPTTNPDGRDLNRPRLGGMPTPQELEDSRKFAREHAPNRYALFDQLPEGRARMRVGTYLVQRYRQMQSMRDESPEIYKLNVQRFEDEDAAFGFARDLLREKGSATAPSDTEAKLRDKVAEIVSLSLQERQKRLERLEAKLNEEQEALQADQGNVESLVDKQLNQLKTTAEDLQRRFDEFNKGRNRAGAANGDSAATTSH